MGRANHAVSGRRLSAKATAGPPLIVAPSRSTTSTRFPGELRSTRKRASQSSARTSASSRRWPAALGSTRSTRSRVDGTAQITYTAMARYEKTCTDADPSIATWKQTATHTAA